MRVSFVVMCSAATFAELAVTSQYADEWLSWKASYPTFAPIDAAAETKQLAAFIRRMDVIKNVKGTPRSFVLTMNQFTGMDDDTFLRLYTGAKIPGEFVDGRRLVLDGVLTPKPTSMPTQETTLRPSSDPTPLPTSGATPSPASDPTLEPTSGPTSASNAGQQTPTPTSAEQTPTPTSGEQTPAPTADVSSGSKSPAPTVVVVTTPTTTTTTIPENLDWEERGAVSPVLNQQRCGSCWAFAAMLAMESAYKIAGGNLHSGSEQQLVDCSTDNSGCNGGWMATAFKYAMEVDTCSSSSYPYTAEEGTCTANTCSKTVLPKGVISGYKYSKRYDSEDTLLALMRQPLAAAVAVNDVFASYSSGIIDSECPGEPINHGIVLIGFGLESGIKYWNIRNSWGKWGENGNIRLARGQQNDDDGICGINYAPHYPTIDDRFVEKMPTSSPTYSPTSKPTFKPTSKPTLQPTSEPTSDGSASKPSAKPTSEPTFDSSAENSKETPRPSVRPTEDSSPTSRPSADLTGPTQSPTGDSAGRETPSPVPSEPTPRPTGGPIENSSSRPSQQPSVAPTSFIESFDEADFASTLLSSVWMGCIVLTIST
eukprot:TRINITY_DN6155_c0_g1_i1.p1 TRINITY_DN6155_c0_g1~~TRINITY_DN6155_c0_g1_i1.p1  ORF type:complete len:596 (+),score=65.42 TRINITY_DN6155_c0_g1_i1:73-1860(+)